MLRTLPTIVLQVGVVLALVAGTTAFVALDKRVTISVDGHQQQVRSFARTVGDLLDSEDVPYDLAHDLVTPAPSSSLADGETVQVRYGRPVLLTVDGETRTVWTTGRTVSQALMLLGVRSDGAYVSASRSRRIGRGGMALDVRMPHHLTFLADGDPARGDDDRDHRAQRDGRGRRRACATQDRVSADLSAVPYAEQVVGLTRVDGKKAVEERPDQVRHREAQVERPLPGHRPRSSSRARSASRCGPSARPTSTASSTPASWSAPRSPRSR